MTALSLSQQLPTPPVVTGGGPERGDADGGRRGHGTLFWIVLAKACNLLAAGSLVLGYFVARPYVLDQDLRQARIAWIVTAGVALVYFTLALWCLDRPLVSLRVAWWLRWSLKISKRVLMLLQMACVVVAAAVAFNWALGLKLPLVP